MTEPRLLRDFFEAPGSPESIVTCGNCGKLVHTMLHTEPRPELPNFNLKVFALPPSGTWFLSPCHCFFPNDWAHDNNIIYTIHIPESRIQPAPNPPNSPSRPES